MLPVFRRFTMQDTPNAPNWLGNITNPLNLFCETTVQTLNKNLQFGINVQGQKYSTTFITPSGYATGDFNTIQFTYNGGGQPNCVLIGSIAKSDGTLILSPVSITNWGLDINVSPYQVRIGYVAGLAASTKYNIAFLVV